MTEHIVGIKIDEIKPLLNKPKLNITQNFWEYL